MKTRGRKIELHSIILLFEKIALLGSLGSLRTIMDVVKNKFTHSHTHTPHIKHTHNMLEVRKINILKAAGLRLKGEIECAKEKRCLSSWK